MNDATHDDFSERAATALLVFLAAIAVLLALSACGTAKHADPEPDPAPPVQGDRDAWLSTSARAASSAFFDGHCIVSRNAAGGAEHLGDCLIWVGVALAALPCDVGAPIEAAVAADLVARGGKLQRAPSIPDDVSIDGAAGLYRGIVDRVVRCGTAASWRPAVAAMVAYQDAHNGRLNAAVDVRASSAGFGALLPAVAHSVGQGGGPGQNDVGLAAAAVAGWAKAVELARVAWRSGVPGAKPAACFRAHVGYEVLRTLELAGYGIDQVDRDEYCADTAALDLPLTDHWCGRGDLVSWSRSFHYDVYEFRHQRCPAWETPDGNGFRTPGLDEAMALREAFNFQDKGTAL